MTTHGPHRPLAEARSRIPLQLEGFFAGDHAPLQGAWEVSALNIQGTSALVNRVGCDTVRIATLEGVIHAGTPPLGYHVEVAEARNPDAPEMDVLYTGEVH